MTVLSLVTLLALSASGFAEEPRPALAHGESEGFVVADDGARLYFRKLGDGPATLLVPNAIYLEDDLRGLAEGRTVVFYDLRNRGRSARIDDPALLEGGIDNDVADLEAVRRHLGAERVSVLGHSYLGLAVGLWAIAHPERLDRLVQVGALGPYPGKTYPPELRAQDPEPVPSPEEVAELMRRRAAKAWETDTDGYCRFWWGIVARMMVSRPELAARVPTPCHLENESPARFEAFFATHVQPSLQRLAVPAEGWRRVKTPVLVVHGTRDRNAPFGGGVDWAALWPDARLLPVDGAAHVPWIEQPQLVDAIEGFLAGAWPDDARPPAPSPGG